MKKSTILVLFVLAIMVGYTVSALALGSGVSIQGSASIPKGVLQVKAITQVVPYSAVSLDSDDTLSSGQICVNPSAANSDPKFLGYSGGDTIEAGTLGIVYTSGLIKAMPHGAVVANTEIGTSTTAGEIEASQTGGGICLESKTDEVVYVLKIK